MRKRTIVTGEKGLIMSIIYQATKDYERGGAVIKRDAKRYFSSELYHSHLAHLGLAHDMLPTVVKQPYGIN